MRAQLLLAAWAGLACAYPSPRQFPPQFSARLSIISARDNWLYAVDLSVDTPNAIMAMDVHFPEPIGAARIIYNVSGLEYYVIGKGSATDICVSSPLTPGAPGLKNLMDFNPWFWLYLKQMTDRAITAPDDISQFLMDHNYVVNYNSDESGEIKTIEYESTFKLSDIFSSYTLKDNNEMYKMKFKWVDPSRNPGTWQNGWNWGPTGNLSFPVEVGVEIYQNPKDSQHFVTQHIMLSHAEPGILNPELFTIPDHVFCERSTPANFPSWPIQYHFESEVSIPPGFNFLKETDPNGWIFYTHEYYDTQRHVSSAFYQRRDVQTTNANTTSVYSIIDHWTGMAFQFDAANATCRIGPLLELQKFALDDLWDLARLHLADPVSFFDTNHRYSLDGTRVVRGIDTDKLVTQRTDWPQTIIRALPGVNVTTVWEWFISRPNWYAAELYDIVSAVPVRLDITMDMEQPAIDMGIKGTVSYNLFNYHKDEWGFGETIRLGPCLAAAGIPNDTYTVTFDDSDACTAAWSHAMGDYQLKAMLENRIHDTLRHYGGPESPLRILIGTLDPSQPQATIYLTAPFNYSGTARPIKALSSASIKANWTRHMDTTDFAIPIPRSMGVIDLERCAIKSIKTYSPPGRTYTQGEFAGFGVGMLLLGLILGVVVIFLIARFAPSKPLGDNFIRFVNKGYEGDAAAS